MKVYFHFLVPDCQGWRESNELRNTIGYLLTVLLLILVGTVESAEAQLTTYNFTGQITYVSNPPFGLSLTAGDPVTGSIVYDSSLPPAYDTGNVAGYMQSPPSGMSLVIGGAAIQSVGTASLQVLNDGYGVDNFNGYFTPISVNGQNQPNGSAGFSLTDVSQTAFSSTALPQSLHVGSFNSRTGFIFVGSSTVFFSIDTLARPALQVTIDVKPGGFPNSINPRSDGVIPVAILTTSAFDATTVDPTTVLFGATGTEAAAVQSSLEDVDGDGDIDRILHFRTRYGHTVWGHLRLPHGRDLQWTGHRGVDSIKTVGGQ